MSLHDELTIDVSDIAPVHLELEATRAHDLVGPYGAFVATMAPAEQAQPWGTVRYGQPYSPPYARTEWRSAAPTSAWAARALDALGGLPAGAWHRLALYGFLFFLFGNLLRCGGLSAFTNVSCVLVTLLGLAGTVASAHRSP
jgi:hypothetical protein